MAKKMATLPEAQRLMEELRIASYEPAMRELAEVQEFAKSKVCFLSPHSKDPLPCRPGGLLLQPRRGLLLPLHSAPSRRFQVGTDDLMNGSAPGHQGETAELRQWDISFWAERLREDKYAITDEELRPYFALPNVLEVCGQWRLV